MNSWIDLHALWQIVVVSLICGAGLPALFAVGLRALSLGAPRPAAVDGPSGTGAPTTTLSTTPVGIAAASVCFAMVLAAIGWGIYLIVSAS
jgi:hypothetical protein